MRDMNELQRITTSYVDLEDRFKLVAALEQDRVVTLWLSQRLLRRLLPMLLSWLGNADASSKVQGQKSSTSSIPPLEEEKVEPPVLEANSFATHLIKEVEIKQSTEQIFLGFKDQDALYTLALNQVSLKQWLDIIKMLWNAADWPTEVWPKHFDVIETKNDSLVIH